ncbi:MAG: nuclear transport factor 2 family protein [Xanthobacteraceae bacterium]|nr:nuclear transport factor 2 family protein [Xanthobacteraceae bacterium]
MAMNVTKRNVAGGLIAVAALFSAPPCSAEVKKVAYPEVKVTLEKPYKPDAAFEKMHAAFLDAVQRKDLSALVALVAPTFLWTVSDQPADELDLGRDAIHNFKVAFGFRPLGQDVDGGVDNGPYWEVLATFAEDTSYYVANDAGNLVCGPVAAEVADDKVFDQARRKIDAVNEPVEWYFTLAETSVARAPGDTGAPVGKVGTIALPLIGFYPPEKEGAPPPAPTHFEVLLPSGRTGWVPVAAVRPLETDHLCYARTPAGEWKIAAIDQAASAP